jgi:diguanylate cyclase (GGDEF)-like protein
MEQEPARTATGEAGTRRPRALGPAGLIALMAVTASLLCAPLLSASLPAVVQPTLPWFVLVALWVPFELVVLRLQVGDDPDNANTFVLTEIPLALGLLLCSPIELVAVGVATPVVIDAVRRDKGLTKQLFNGTNKAVEVGVAVTLYRLMAPTDPLSPAGWVALCVALGASSLTTSALVSVVLGLVADHMPLRDFALHCGLTVPMALLGATVGFCNALGLQRGLTVAPPLVVSLVALLLLLRGFTMMTERHASVTRLHALGHRLASAPDVASVMLAALDASKGLLRARHATVYLPLAQDGGLAEVTEGPDGQLRTARIDQAGLPAERGIVHRRTTLVADAPLRAGREVVLVVTGRLAPVRAYDGEDLRVLEMVAHQTAQALHTAHLIDQLRRDALHDSLTDLPNRRSVVESLQQRIGDGEGVLVVCFGLLDLDKVNAALGHDRGDQLLVEVAHRMRAASDPACVVARVSDDSFALVGCQRMGLEPVTAVLDALASPFTVSGVEVAIRACAGVARPLEGAATTGADLLRRADIAMRHARDTGRDVETYVADLDTATAAELSLASDLRTGIARGELVLHAQPQVRLTDGAVTGMEMLVRWQHPTMGLLQPGAFLPLAERTGLDAAVTAWVLHEATAVLARWRATGLEVTCSVNVPTSALANRDLCRLVERLLALHGVPGEQLVVEITETGLLTNLAATTEVLHGLAALGVRISIDDFGTGFSSMSRLRHLPVDEVKIDRSFVTTMVQDRDDEAIVRSIIELARSLGLACVAEGIEDADVYAALQRFGCDIGQGYFMARPMAVEDVVDWVASSPHGRASRAAWASGGLSGVVALHARRPSPQLRA